MRVEVDSEECIGCGSCEEICPEVFELQEDSAIVKMDPVPPEHEDAVREAAENCPVECINIIEE